MNSEFDNRLLDQINELFLLVGAKDHQLPEEYEVNKLPGFYCRSPRQGALRILAERLKLTDIIPMPLTASCSRQITDEYRENANLHSKMIVLIDMLNAQSMKEDLDKGGE